ncbi:MAG: protein kinase [Planctomycetes bacterium]|nr:protein kinase [Planctomycetota bacterium]
MPQPDPRWDRLKDLFAAAAPIPAGERESFLKERGVGDATIVEVIALLKAHEPVDEQPGDTIGPYKLLENLGEGGFGTVWMAEQRAPVQRRVALKVLKAGMDSAQVLARFEQERQALALMQHPNIAQVYDAGTTKHGRPFFVMELVKGIPITDYASRERLTIQQRLELFVQVCRAVQHAHHKGVVHRDIKPRNVLVATADGRPLAKVIDFGIAKAVTGRLTERTLFTEHRAMIGTLEYMSPEQAEGLLDVDTRADVYSLGALLYELLTGSTPFVAAKLLEAGFGEMLRTLREVEPERPSVRVSSKAGAGWAASGALGGRDPKQLFGSLRGDLDWVVMKALEKDRARRYGTADGLAADVESYLRGEAVTAVPPSVGYRVRKFVRRNRALVVGGTAVVLTLVVGIVGIGWALGLAKEEQEKMRSAAATAVQVMERVVGAGDGSMSLHVTDWGSQPVGADERDHARVVVVLESLAEHAETIRAELTARERSVTVLEYSARLSAAMQHVNAAQPAVGRQVLAGCEPTLRGLEWLIVSTRIEDDVHPVPLGIRRLEPSDLQREMGPEIRTLDFSRDSRRLAVAGDEHLVVVRCGSWFEEVRLPIDVEGWFWIDFFADDWIAFDGEIRIDLRGGKRTNWALAPTTINLDGTLAASMASHRITVHRTIDGAAVFAADAPHPGTLQFSSDSRWLACRGNDRTSLWETTAGGRHLVVPESVALSPLGPWAIGETRVVDLSAANTDRGPWEDSMLHVYTFVGRDAVLCFHQPEWRSYVVELPSGRRLSPPIEVKSLSDGSIVVPEPMHRVVATHDSSHSIAIETGERLAPSICGFRSETAFSPNGIWIATLDDAGQLLIAAARPPQVALPKSADPVLSLGYTHRRESLAIRSVTRSFDTVFVPDTGVPHHKACTRHIAVAAGSGNGRFQLRIDAQGHAVRTTADSPDLELAHAELLACRALALDHTGACAAAIADDRVLHWSFDAGATARATPAEVCPIPTGPSGIPVLAVHGPTVLLGDAAGILRRYELGSPSVTHTERIGAAALTALRCSPDGSLVLVGCANGICHLRRTADLGLVVALAGHFDAVTAAAWTPDGTRIATGSRDGTVRLWPTEATPLGDQVTPFLTLTEPQIRGRPTALLVTPDGERLVCGYDDGALRVWDTVPWAQRAATVPPLFPRAAK